MLVDHERVMMTLLGDGNGHRGLAARFDNFVTRWDERRKIEEETANTLRTRLEIKQSKDSRRNSIINFALLVVAMVSLLGLVLQIHMAVQEHRLNFPKISGYPEQFNATLQTTGPIIYDAITGRR